MIHSLNIGFTAKITRHYGIRSTSILEDKLYRLFEAHMNMYTDRENTQDDMYTIVPI